MLYIHTYIHRGRGARVRSGADARHRLAAVRALLTAAPAVPEIASVPEIAAAAPGPGAGAAGVWLAGAAGLDAGWTKGRGEIVLPALVLACGRPGVPI